MSESRPSYEELRRSEEHFRFMFEHLQDVYYEVTLDGVILEVSPSISTISKYSREELLGTSLDTLYVNPATRDQVLDVLLQHGSARDIEIQLRDKDGATPPLSISAVLVMDSEGRPWKVCGTLRDITRRKEIEHALRDSETRHRLLADNALDVIWTMDLQAHFTYISPSIEKLRGYTPTEVMHQPLDQVLAPASAMIVQKAIAQTLDAISTHAPVAPYQVELEQPCKDGRMIWTESTISGMYDTTGELIGFIGVTRDITERKHAEEQLATTQANLKALLNNTDGIIVSRDLEGRAIEFNEAFSNIVKKIFNIDAAHDTNTLDYLPPEQKAYWQQVLARVHAGEIHRQVFTWVIDGESRYYDLSMRPIWAGGVIVGSSEFNVDITERKRTEEALRMMTQRLQLATASGRLGIWEWEIPTNSLIWNDRMFELYGLDRATFPGTFDAWQSRLHPDDAPAAIAAAHAALRGEQEYSTEFRIVLPDGTLRTLRANASVLRAADGVPQRMIGLNRDITRRRQREEALRLSEEKFQKAFQISPDAININRLADGVYLEINAGFTALTGYTADDVIGRSSLPGAIDIWVNSDDRQRLLAGLRAKGEVIGEETLFRCKDGTIRICLMSARLIEINREDCILSITRDITDRRKSEVEHDKLQAQLTQAQKMESVGRLAGGVAHDFNNMLGVILGNAELALARLTPADPVYDDLTEIIQAATRSADLTRQLLAFARKQTVAPKVLDLNETIAGMLRMLRRLIGEDIHLTWQPGADLWPVYIDPAQVDQVLANLCVNARDAITGVGKVTIETHNAVIDETFRTAHTEATLGDYLLLSVRDDGCGIDPAMQAHLFEPFFTTKEIGQGTGLGLATVYGIVKQNNGYIYVSSEPGRGAIFHIYLPRHPAPAVSVFPDGAACALQGGKETILLVEDEEAILLLGTRLLLQQGYEVLAASTPGEAIRQAENHDGEIDLILTDVVMPEMNGRDLAQFLHRRHPNLKRLFMSGYTADVIAHHGILERGVHFLQKPFTIQELTAKVREVLDQ